MENLNDLLEKVIDQESFLIFVKALYKDKVEDTKIEKQSPSNSYSSSKNGWETSTIEQFLEHAIGWAEDSSFQEDSNHNLWYQFASFLFAGKIYE